MPDMFKMPKAMPAPQPTVRMPDQEDPDLLEAGRRRRREEEQRRGRAATNLDQGGGMGGAPAYTNERLG